MGCGASKSVLANEVDYVKCGKNKTYLCRSSEVKHSLGVVFDAMAHREAVIHLLNSEDVTEYEIVLGAENNKMTRAYKLGSQESADVESLGIMDPTNYHRFWITWKLNSLCVGKGYSVGKQEILSLPMQREDGNFKPYALQVSCKADRQAEFKNVKLLFEEDF